MNKSIVWSSVTRAVVQAVRAWIAHSAQRKGASIAFYAIFALAPLLLVVVAIAGLVFGEDAARGYVVGQLSGLVGRHSAETIQALLATAWSDRSGGVIAVVSGLVTLLFGVTGVFVEMSDAIDETWGATGERTWTAALRARVAALGAVVGFGFLVIVSLTLSAILEAASKWMATFSDSTTILLQVVNFVVSSAVLFGAFCGLFRGLSHAKVGWRTIWVSALATTVLFVIGKELIALYLGRASTTSTYGAAGSFVAIILWVYYTSQIMLLGAEFGRALTGVEPAQPAEADHIAPAKPA
ncbi:MAG: YihY/virulence factor BrkB family protein [Burkholderiaceae bacterium]